MKMKINQVHHFYLKLKNIMVSSNDPSGVVNATFHSFPSFIHTLLYPYHRFNLVNTLFVPIFSIMSEIRDKE